MAKRVVIAYPPLSTGKGVPLLSQNRQFQWFNVPTYIYPVVPAYAATMLKKAGHNVLWADGIAAEESYEEWERKVVDFKPDFIMMETKTPVVKLHWEIIDKLKLVLRDTKVVLVGDHITALPEESFENSRVDYVLTGGDYDFLMVELLEYIEGKRKSIPEGIYYREGDSVKSTGKFSLHRDLNSLPFIDRELTKWRLYSKKNGNFKRTPGTYTMVGRDCWYHKCSFCSWTTLYPSFRTRKPESLVEEIGSFIDMGIKEVMDDSGTFPVGDWIRRFANLYIESGYHKKIGIDCNMRFGALTFDDYKLLKKANFRFLLFGIESANQYTLDRINKGLKLETIIESVKLARKAGLYPHITIMFGYPWEDYEMAKKTLELGKWLLKKGYAYTMQSTIVIPYPGTPLYDECVENNWLTTNDWNDFDMRKPVMKVPMSEEELMGLVQGLYSVSFHPEFLFHKVMSVRDISDVRYFSRAFFKVIGHLLDFRGGRGK